MSKSVQQMSAAEYKEWLLTNPEEAKKLDEPGAPAVAKPTGLWRNGVWVELPNGSQVAHNGSIQ